MSDGYQFSPIVCDDSGLAAMSTLLLGVFPRARQLTPAYLRWLYRENPDGEALGLNAFHGGRLVGHCAGVPLVATIDGEARRGIILVNAAVDRDHRRKNITRRTTDPMFEQAAAAGYDFAISTGNRYSTLPLLTRFEMVGRLDARIGVGSPRRTEPAPAPSFERDWSGAALRWRLANPEGRYSVRHRAGTLSVIAATGTPGIGAVLFDGPDRWVPDESGPSPAPLRVWLGLDPAMRWSRSAFLPIPSRLRPSPLNLLYKALSGQGYLPDPSRIVFRALDFDPY